MTRGSAEEAARKTDRALELYERGIRQAVIAERLGVRPTHVGSMLQRARQRREKLREKVE
jgi:DNA-binding transcriptional regulator LsrR (DeoR family)